MSFTVGSVFSGIGGLDLAAHWAGFETKWFVEKEPFCQQILHKHWPGVAVHSDVFECHDLPHVDVIVGGFPCQPFSVAGNRRGADDERYLLPEMLRIISEVKPYAVLFENVPGFPSLNDGAEFKYLLRALAEMGFDAEWGHLRASDCGAPHQRERWFLVAYAAGIRREQHTTRQGQNRLQQGQTSEFTRGNKTHMVNTAQCTGYIDESHAGKQQQTVIATTGKRDDRKPVRRSTSVANPIRNGNGGTGRALHHSNRDGSQKERRRIIKQHGVITSSRRAAKPVLGGNVNGLPGWLDFVGWPARPGEDQHAYEPSRVTTDKLPNRAARLKALGNAVVPQVAYPLFAAIYAWLEESIERETR